jgi:hypothetical protein
MSKYYDIKYDKYATRSQYVPYLNNINEEYITLFNKNILMKKFQYHKDQKNPNNFITNQNRYINDDDRTIYYKKELDDVVLLYDRISSEFKNAISKYKKKLADLETKLNQDIQNVTFENVPTDEVSKNYIEMNNDKKAIYNLKNTIELYTGYSQKIDSHLSNQISYLESIIDKINNINNEESIVDIFRINMPNIKLLILMFFILISLFISIYLFK